RRAEAQPKQAGNHHRASQPDPEKATITGNGAAVGNTARPDAQRREKIAQADEKADRRRAETEVSDHDAVPDTGRQYVRHTGAEMEQTDFEIPTYRQMFWL